MTDSMTAAARQGARLLERQRKAAIRIRIIAASVSNEDIASEMDSLFANIISACYAVENEASKAVRHD